MAIPESQFETWAKQGATANAQLAHTTIRRALDVWPNWSVHAKYESYLQGSYRNSTNIWRDSDVDLVVELTGVVRYDMSQLSHWQRQRADGEINWVEYSWPDFRAEVVNALLAYFDAYRIDTGGTKTIKVSGFNGLIADVVVCMKQKTILHYPIESDRDVIECMTFYVVSEDRWVVNYPKLHIRNGEQKNTKNEWYKPTVRVFKNMKRYMVDNGMLVDRVAPSYFIECLMYNVPNSQFGESYRSTVDNTLKWIMSSELDHLMCQNGITKLVGSSPEQWGYDNIMTFLRAVLDLQKNW